MFEDHSVFVRRLNLMNVETEPCFLKEALSWHKYFLYYLYNSPVGNIERKPATVILLRDDR